MVPGHILRCKIIDQTGVLLERGSIPERVCLGLMVLYGSLTSCRKMSQQESK